MKRIRLAGSIAVVVTAVVGVVGCARQQAQAPAATAQAAQSPGSEVAAANGDPNREALGDGNGQAMPAAAASVAPRAPTVRMADADLQKVVDRAHQSFRRLKEGKNADYIPSLAQVDPNLFGVVLATVDGRVFEAGDTGKGFSIQSVGKVFTLARLMEDIGVDGVAKRIGVNATGMPFNSILAIELNEKHRAGNPFVNAGAITQVSLMGGTSVEQKWSSILAGFSRFAGRPLTVDQEIYRSESETNTRNRSIVQLLKAYEVVQGDPMQALDLYTRMCSISVTARDLAVMGATLANGGTNPVSGEKVVDARVAQHVLSVMMTAGLYETSGEWAYAVGVPAKSGVGGGIVAVVPGRFAIGTFAPPLDEAGNSVRGQRAIAAIVGDMQASLFAATPSVPNRRAAEAPKPAPIGPAAAR